MIDFGGGERWACGFDVFFFPLSLVLMIREFSDRCCYVPKHFPLSNKMIILLTKRRGKAAVMSIT